jgi:hypothetical protein
MQMDPESMHDKSSLVNTAFLKSGTFWLRLVLIALLTTGWVSMLQLDVLDSGTNSALNLLGTDFLNSDCTLYFDIRDYVMSIYLGTSITGWILSILYVLLNIFSVQKYLGKFALRTFVRYLKTLLQH